MRARGRVAADRDAALSASGAGGLIVRVLDMQSSTRLYGAQVILGHTLVDPMRGLVKGVITDILHGALWRRAFSDLA